MLTHVDINIDNKIQKNSKAFECECGKEYKYRQSLYVHKKKCTYNAEEPIENTFVPEEAKRQSINNDPY